MYTLIDNPFVMNLKSSLVGLALLSLSFRPAFAQSPLWTNLVSYWPFDTVAGGVTPDLSLGNDLPPGRFCRFCP